MIGMSFDSIAGKVEINPIENSLFNRVVSADSYEHSKSSRAGVALAAFAAAAAASYLVFKRNPQLAYGLTREITPIIAGESHALPALRALPDLASGLRLPQNLAKVGQDLRFSIDVDGLARGFTVHLPPGFNPTRSTPVYYLMDGLQVNKPAGEMLSVNGWAQTADKNGLVAVALEHVPHSRVFGLPGLSQITSWSVEHGLLNKIPEVDDMRFFSSVHNRIGAAMNVDSSKLVGFSDGSSLIHQLSAHLPKGSIHGISTVAGTTLETAPAPQPGIQALFINMEKDPTLSLTGGPGRTLARLLSRTGQMNVLNSNPGLQELRYARANGLSLSPKVTETALFSQRDYLPAANDQAAVRSYILKEGGHTWPGRATGPQTDSLLTKFNGATVPRAKFSTNDIIVQFFNDERRVQPFTDLSLAS